MEYVSNNKIPEVDTFYDAKQNPTSDHLPVFSEIKFKEKLPDDFLSKLLDNFFPKVSNKVFKLRTSGKKSLRLQANGNDPNKYYLINNNFFKGLSVSPQDELIFPNGNEVNEFVLVVDRNNPNIIGYIKKSDLISVGDYFKLNSLNDEFLRLQPDSSAFPIDGRLNNTPFRGNIINNNNQFVYPNGEEVEVDFYGQKIIYILIQKKDNPNVFGYVNKDYLIENQSGGYYEKYQKYKYKYIELKKTN